MVDRDLLTRPEGPAFLDVLKNDKDFLVELGINEADAANICGKSKQSIYQAELAERKKPYFKDREVVAIVRQAKIRKPGLELARIVSYLERSRNAILAAEVRDIDPKEADIKKFLGYKTVWIIINDWGYLSSEQPIAIELFRSILSREDGDTYFFVCNPFDEANLLSEFGNLPSVHTSVEAWMGAFHFQIVGNPDSNKPDCYVLSAGRFILHDWYNGKKHVELIKSVMVNPPKEFIPMDALLDKIANQG